MTRIIITLLLFFSISFTGVSQKGFAVSSASEGRLQIISRQHKTEYEQRKNEALEYAVMHQIPVKRKLDDGRVMELQYIDKNGLPVYHTTFNAVAAFTVSTHRLHPEGELGLNLTGSNYRAGVWDAGIADTAHQEFYQRITSKDSYDEPDDHATHVTGTIAAEGVNSDARGMAFGADIISYDWNNYKSDIAKEAADGMLITNHSYGIKLGWTREDGEWEWNGDPDADEDYRFGFYNTFHSRSLDEIAYNAPGLLMVWSAGNSRTGDGDGTREPNGPYDCIGPEAIAKNVLAVGAVNKISSGYNDASDVKMTSFSSWGPSDDGRVKPDIVAPGQGLFSTLPDDGYGTSSGTSMAAPVVSGSLILLQEHFHNLNGHYMRSASLKGLVIHTAYDAGKSRGPDYSFGWGMLNTAAAADLISGDDGISVFVKELSLDEGEIYEFEIYSDGISDITATLSWTDLPGTPPPADSINPPDLMLVNDLDIRITDEAGNIYYPWILNPDEPGDPAEKGDNFRDNVEKILIENPEPRKYTVTVSHKNDLAAGSQDFSLVFSSSLGQPPGQTSLYWIGGDGDWNDPFGWSLSSGGEPADILPDSDINVVIDENSFSDSSHMLSLGSDVDCRSFSWLAKEGNGIAFNGYDISVYADFTLSGGIFGVNDRGSFIFRGLSGKINTGNNMGDALRFVFDNEDGEWELVSNLKVESLVLKAGDVLLSFKDLYIGSFSVEGEKSKFVDLSGSDLYLFTNFDLTGENLRVESEELGVIVNLTEKESMAIFRAENIKLTGVEIISGTFTMVGDNDIGKLVNSSVLYLFGSNPISRLILEKGSETWLDGGSVQTVSGFEVESSPDSIVLLHSLSAESATIIYPDYIKLCFDYMDIYNVEAGGKAIYSAGENSLLTGNTSGWKTGPCEDILFAGFDVKYPCTHSLTNFIDKSEGDITSWFWDFGDDTVSGDTSVYRNPGYTYSYPGEYDVILKISNPDDFTSLKREITIIENTLAENEIFINTELNKYVSTQTAPSYQWYNDGFPIPGETGRTLDTGDYTGEIRVLLTDDKCNRFSEKLVVSVNEIYLPEETLLIYPNPVDNLLNIEFSHSYIGPLLTEVIDISGKVIHSSMQQKSDVVYITSVSPVSWPSGIYLFRIIAGRQVIVKNIIKK